MLADDRARVGAFGERSALDLPFPVAAKTGTSKGFRDNWAVGYTREVTVAVWVGNFDGALGTLNGLGARTIPVATDDGGMQIDALERELARLEAAGIEVVGPTEHTIFKSIYFFDPNGHRLELAVNTGTPDMYKKLDECKWDMLGEWAQTKRAPKHAAWMHETEFKD